MKKKIMRVSGKITVGIAWIMLVLSIGAIALMAIQKFVPDFNDTALLLSLFGEFSFPLSMIINFEQLGTIMFVIALVLLFASIFVIRDVSRVYKQKGNKRFHFISAIVWCVLFAVYFAFNLITICQNYEAIQLLLDVSISSVAYMQWLGSGLVMGKFITICLLFIISTLFTIIAFFVGRERTQRQVIKPIFNVNFYSDEFEQKQQVEHEKNEQEIEQEKTTKKIEETPKHKPKQQSQDLLNRIMQLNEMKDTGQISDVEYTKQRQKAIKRYKV